MTNYPDHFIEYSDAYGLSQPIELYDLIKGDDTKARRLVEQANLKDRFPNFMDASQWLPFASEKYNISEKLEDYVIIPVSIMPTELPNRNGVGFPFEELTAFNPEYGQITYKTWIGKPTFQEHDNSNVERAKGVILDTVMRPLKKYEGNLYHIINLCSYDRNKDAGLVSDILAKKRIGYSMGAFVRDYACSICGSTVKGGGCEHVERGKVNYSIYNNNQLAYFRAIEPVGFETSNVAVPAYITATNPDATAMWME